MNFLINFSTDGVRQVVPLEPPVESKPGERVTVEGYGHDKMGGTCIMTNVIYSESHTVPAWDWSGLLKLLKAWWKMFSCTITGHKTEQDNDG